MATVQQVPPASNPNEVLGTHKKAMKGLAITEVVLGCLSLITGAIQAGSIYAPTVGEGIWCGIFVIVAGAVGIPASGPNSTRILVNCHLAFCIVGAIFSFILFIINIIWTISRFIFVIGFALAVIQDILSFVCLCILPASAGLCCQSLPGCCAQGAVAHMQVSYVTTTSQPVAVQGAPPGGYVVQGYQAPGQFVTTTIPAQPVGTMQAAPGSPTQVGYNAQAYPSQPGNYPPKYQ